MSAPAVLSPTTSFPRLSKALTVVLVAGFLAHAVAPATISGTFSLIPGRFIPYVWNVFTPGFLETSITGVVMGVVALVVVGRHLELVWGAPELLKFVVFVNVFACSSTFVLAIFLYFLTRQGYYLYTPISGFHGVVAGMLVAVKQSNPEQETPFKLRVKWSPSLFVAFVVATSLFAVTPFQLVPFVLFGTYGAWIYLRYLQRKPEAGLKGDASAEFAFATFFPVPMQSFVRPVAAICEKVFCWQRNQAAGEAPGVEMGQPLPGSDAVEASRRRERGARALEERLGASAATTGAVSVPMKGASNLEVGRSHDLV